MNVKATTALTGSVASARTLREAVSLALSEPGTAAAIARAAGSSRFPRYVPVDGPTAALAVSAMFERRERAAAEEVVEGYAETDDRHGEALEAVMRSRAYSRVRDAVAAALASRFPLATPREIARALDPKMAERAMREIRDSDLSGPADGLEGVPVLVCYVPGLDRAGSLAATMTRWWSDESSSLTAVPDEAFMRFLSLAGVSVARWTAAVAAVHGEDPAALPPCGAEEWKKDRHDAWAGAAARCRVPDDAEPVADVERLIHAVDACYLGFTPLVAFTAEAAALCYRDWTRPMAIRGGVLGLPDFVNGTGDPVRFERRVAFHATLAEMIPGSGHEFDFWNVHGFPEKAFRTKLSYAARPGPAVETPSAPVP